MKKRTQKKEQKYYIASKNTYWAVMNGDVVLRMGLKPILHGDGMLPHNAPMMCECKENLIKYLKDNGLEKRIKNIRIVEIVEVKKPKITVEKLK